jgi:anti-anti-sigma factor
MGRIERLPGAAVVRMHDRPCFTPEDHERVKGLLCDAGRLAPRLIIDCEEVTIVTGSFLSALVVSGHLLGARAGDVVLCQVNDLVRTVFEATHLDRVFPIVATRADALTVEAAAPAALIRQDSS